MIGSHLPAQHANKHIHHWEEKTLCITFAEFTRAKLLRICHRQRFKILYVYHQYDVVFFHTFGVNGIAKCYALDTEQQKTGTVMLSSQRFCLLSPS